MGLKTMGPVRRLMRRVFRSRAEAEGVPSEVALGETVRAALLAPISELTEEVQALRNGASYTPAHCQNLASLVGASGAAILSVDRLGEACRLVCAAGTWEGQDLEVLLADSTCEWALAMERAVVPACCDGGHPRVSRGGLSGGAASAFAVPFSDEGCVQGAFLLTYDKARAMTPIEWAIGRLLGSYVALGMSHQRLSAKARVQAKRITRLTDDIERMAVSLGRGRGEHRKSVSGSGTRER